MTTILKEMRIAQLGSYNERTLVSKKNKADKRPCKSLKQLSMYVQPRMRIFLKGELSPLSSACYMSNFLRVDYIFDIHHVRQYNLKKLDL